ncbi:MAG: RNA polymerase sigma factor [Acidimicrobiales bacterium]
MSDEATLQTLVRQAGEYDPGAWEALYRRVYQPLYGYALRRLAEPLAAEDAVSETMTRALDRIGQFTWKGAGFEAWLYGILRNVVHEAWRASARTARASSLPVPVAEASPPEVVIAGEEAAAVRRAFADLSAEDQEVLELRVVSGLSAEQVAAVQGRRAGAVRMAQHRALARLHALLGEVGDD